MIVLGVETSCDETSVAIYDGKTILSNIVLSQIDIHQEFGGVVPEVASRHHVRNVSIVFKQALKEANLKPEDIDLVAVTEGPGLIGSLLVGITAAKTFALCYDKPIIGVNHLAGHIYANQIESEMKFPLLALLVSGGNTELILMKDHFEFEVLGETLDDAVGEAYDKVARVCGLPYPGGPHVDRLAALGNDTYNLPRVMINSKDYNFSFSGLKSAVINLAHNLKQKNQEINIEDLCCSFQKSVIEVLVSKTYNCVKEFDVKQVIVAGGVSANKGLRQAITSKFENENVEVVIPPFKYCTDNAAMIASCGYYQYQKDKKTRKLDINGISNLEL
ncbi:MAG: tRNA (adenosine(37)-N6)-threonylcarbamoyltransferase complex transferase subunit TsaD [bacterium]